ncbi:Outer membrane protein beta-barrel domain-containing protein [Marivirga sericea]|uniref:Outer membrane protein beta-barrel domain-containing protein n=1 Tax=Marivirga sericea TaxID=1028 RepID=A0A1X7I403_9BACT|nr:porin family protein [Marivirga sericea]SMG08445.1 Outer membrane protein beta-barrel domain-containing protein [Marivirga sericea]
MKKLFTLTALLFFIGSVAKAQIFTIGPKFGVSNTTLSIKDNVGEYKSGDAKFSYHGGIFARIKITGFYVQPEIYFNSVRGEYINPNPNLPVQDQTIEFNRNKIDLPILVGWKMGPLRINAGPVASFNLDNEIPNNTNSAVSEYKSSVFAYQAGIGVDISKIIIDLRYEGNLSNQATLGNDEGNVRVNQIMLSVGLKLL